MQKPSVNHALLLAIVLVGCQGWGADTDDIPGGIETVVEHVGDASAEGLGTVCEGGFVCPGFPAAEVDLPSACRMEGPDLASAVCDEPCVEVSARTFLLDASCRPQGKRSGWTGNFTIPASRDAAFSGTMVREVHAFGPMTSEHGLWLASPSLAAAASCYLCVMDLCFPPDCSCQSLVESSCPTGCAMPGLALWANESAPAVSSAIGQAVTAVGRYVEHREAEVHGGGFLILSYICPE
jgi:hypothetical protein